MDDRAPFEDDRVPARRVPTSSAAAKRQFRFLKPTIVSLFPKRGVVSPKGGRRKNGEPAGSSATPIRKGKVDREVFAIPP